MKTVYKPIKMITAKEFDERIERAKKAYSKIPASIRNKYKINLIVDTIQVQWAGVSSAIKVNEFFWAGKRGDYFRLHNGDASISIRI